MNQTMVVARRKSMAEYISGEGISIVLHRPTFTTTSTGGYSKGTWTDLPAQIFRLIPYSRRLTALVNQSAEGEVATNPWVLVGYYNADVKRMDEFVIDGIYYRVQAIDPATSDPNTRDRIVAQLITLDSNGVAWT